MARTNKEIYDQEKRNAPNIASSEHIAMNAMYILRKELEEEFKQKLEQLDIHQEEVFIDYGEK